jgi:O-antigen ligase
MSASGVWSLIALALGFVGAGMNGAAAWKWQRFEPGHARIALNDEDATLIRRLTIWGWCLILLGAVCGAIGILVQ